MPRGEPSVPIDAFRRPFVAVRAIITDPDNRVLVLQRNDKSIGGGRWCLPGGKIDFGETVDRAIRKEINEETGLVCESARFLFYQDSLAGTETPLHFINLYFECRVSGEISLNTESATYAWMAKDDIREFALVFGNGEAIGKFWNR